MCSRPGTKRPTRRAWARCSSFNGDARLPPACKVSESFSQRHGACKRPSRPRTASADPAKAVQALETAARKVEADHGALDIAWGDVYRLRGNGLDLPANGGDDPWGIFRATFYRPAEDGHFVAVGGDTYVAAVEFADPVRARVLLTYGNATQPHSPHLYDQLELYARKELREAWLTRAEVEAHLESREVLSAAPR